jgi:hypothetical protein
VFRRLFVSKQPLNIVGSLKKETNILTQDLPKTSRVYEEDKQAR